MSRKATRATGDSSESRPPGRARSSALSCWLGLCLAPLLVGPVGCGGGTRSSEAGDGGTRAAATASWGEGEVLAYRFVDHAGEARVSGDLAAAFRTIQNHPQRSLLPYAQLPGEAAFRAVQMAFSDADVEHYGLAREGAGDRGERGERGDGPGRADRAAHAPVKFDPVWNREHAVYQSRQALYVPAGASQTYHLRAPAGARLLFSLGLIGGAGERARFRVLVDGRTALDEVVATRETWLPRSIVLGAPGAAEPGTGTTAEGGEVSVSFLVEDGRGPRTAARGAEGEGQVKAQGHGQEQSSLHGFFGNPLLYGRGPIQSPNVIFILVDTLRADALSVMPSVQRFARNGARFDQAIASATWTRPSMLAMYGGDLPTAVGQSAEDMIPKDADRRRFYRLAPPLLPRVVSSRGLRTAAIGNNFFLLGYPAIGLDLGFEEVDDVRHPVEDTPAITRAAIRFLEQNRDRPFFLHLHYDAPHWPYTPPPAYRNPARIAGWHGSAALQQDPHWARYLGEAAYADDNVAEVLAAVARLGLGPRTMVVIVGDHGEVFDPAHDETVLALNLPTLYHHGWSAWDEILRVPLLFALPGTIAPTVVPSQVRLFDVGPTILDYLDLPGDLLPGRGRSLRPLIEGREHADRVALSEGQNIRALREGGFLYLVRTDGHLLIGHRAADVREELYDVTRDPEQHDNLAAKRPEVLARMRALFAREAPTPPSVPGLVYHLRIAADEHPHRLGGVVRLTRTDAAGAPVDGRLAVRGVEGGTVVGEDHGTLRLDLRGPGGVDFVVDPPDATVELLLLRDGVPLPPRRLLCGEFALPLIEEDGPLSTATLERLDARRPPEPGSRGEVMIYRDPDAHGAAQAQAAEPNDADEVSNMMQRWGYAQPTDKPRGPATPPESPTTPTP